MLVLHVFVCVLCFVFVCCWFVHSVAVIVAVSVCFALFDVFLCVCIVCCLACVLLCFCFVPVAAAVCVRVVLLWFAPPLHVVYFSVVLI